jgi:hypothetical protein
MALAVAVAVETIAAVAVETIAAVAVAVETAVTILKMRAGARKKWPSRRSKRPPGPLQSSEKGQMKNQ